MRPLPLLILSLLWTLCSTGRAAELPSRPTLDRPLPLGQTALVDGVEHKCFDVAEWRAVGALILDYRTLLAWATLAEGVLIDRTMARDARALEAAELHRALVAAEADYRAQVTAMQATLDATERRRRLQAWGFGGLAVLGLGTALVVAITP